MRFIKQIVPFCGLYRDVPDEIIMESRREIAFYLIALLFLLWTLLTSRGRCGKLILIDGPN